MRILERVESDEKKNQEKWVAKRAEQKNEAIIILKYHLLYVQNRNTYIYRIQEAAISVQLPLNNFDQFETCQGKRTQP